MSGFSFEKLHLPEEKHINNSGKKTFWVHHKNDIVINRFTCYLCGHKQASQKRTVKPSTDIFSYDKDEFGNVYFPVGDRFCRNCGAEFVKMDCYLDSSIEENLKKIEEP